MPKFFWLPILIQFDFGWISLQIIPLTAAVIVTTPQKLSFIDVAKGVRMFSKLKVILLVLNDINIWFCYFLTHAWNCFCFPFSFFFCPSSVWIFFSKMFAKVFSSYNLSHIYLILFTLDTYIYVLSVNA